MDLIRRPLADRAAAMSAAEVPGIAAIRELPLAAQIGLRGDGDDKHIVDAVRSATGLDLPIAPNTVATQGDCAALWLSPDEWLIVGPFDRRADMIDTLRKALAGRHSSVTDVSANRTMLELSGSKAREMIAKGCGLDLHPRSFASGQCAQTLVARSQALIWQTDDAPTYRLFVRPSFAAYLADFLVDAMKECALDPLDA
jgi:sarcosine oxidase subunit gamma